MNKSNATKAIGRRQFLRMLGVSGIAGMMLKAGLDMASRTATVSDTRVLMGTVVNLTLVTTEPQAGWEAIAACMDAMACLEAIMSCHRPDSQIARLNRQGQLIGVDAHLEQVLREAKRVSALTDGAFDVTIKPLSDLYKTSLQANETLPADEAVHSVLELVSYRHLRIDDGVIAFARPGMGVTLDGIAKGYIVDQGVLVLQEHGFDNVMVEAGGDVLALGTNGNHAPWHLGIQPPREGGNGFLHTFSVTNRAVATSGDYMQPYTADFSTHHILDPRTGCSAPELASATVMAETGMLADALATALMVMGPARGLELIEALPACEAYLVAKDLTVWQSSGFDGVSQRHVAG